MYVQFTSCVYWGLALYLFTYSFLHWLVYLLFCLFELKVNMLLTCKPESWTYLALNSEWKKWKRSNYFITMCWWWVFLFILIVLIDSKWLDRSLFLFAWMSVPVSFFKLCPEILKFNFWLRYKREINYQILLWHKQPHSMKNFWNSHLHKLHDLRSSRSTFRNFLGKRWCRGLFINTTASCRHRALLKRDIGTDIFLWILRNVFKTAFSYNAFGRLCIAMSVFSLTTRKKEQIKTPHLDSL